MKKVICFMVLYCMASFGMNSENASLRLSDVKSPSTPNLVVQVASQSLNSRPKSRNSYYNKVKSSSPRHCPTPTDGIFPNTSNITLDGVDSLEFHSELVHQNKKTPTTPPEFFGIVKELYPLVENATLNQDIKICPKTDTDAEEATTDQPMRKSKIDQNSVRRSTMKNFAHGTIFRDTSKGQIVLTRVFDEAGQSELLFHSPEVQDPYLQAELRSLSSSPDFEESVSQKLYSSFGISPSIESF